MSERDDRLKSIRPKLGADRLVSSEIEIFQTDTLRPIFKISKQHCSCTVQKVCAEV